MHSQDRRQFHEFPAATEGAAASALSMVVPKAQGTRDRAPEPIAEESIFASSLVKVLIDLGTEHAFGIFGGGIAPFSRAVARSSINLLHCRHEGGAAFAAIESSLHSGRLTVVLATTGPGLTNLYTGMVAARAEGARVLFVTGGTVAAQRGRMAFQETSASASAMSPLFSSGPLFHYAAMIESANELDAVVSRLRTGVTRPGGFVAHLGLPMSTQTGRVSSSRCAHVSAGPPPVCDAQTVQRCIELLSPEPFVIWVGFGARDAAPAIRELVRRTGARVMSTPRGKGIIAEDDPHYLGVTGLGGHAKVEAYFDNHRPQRVLVLGSRLGEMTSFWSKRLLPKRGFVHVDLDPEVFGAAFPESDTIGVQSEIGGFVNALIEAWPEGHRTNPPRDNVKDLPRPRRPRAEPGVRPSYLMERVQRLVVERTRAPILTEAGNAFALGSHYLHFREPKRYRVSTSFGSMGQAAAGVVGAALASGGKAFAILGDGAMLMQNEINTAATYRIDAVWIVLNDARYGMIEQGMQSIGWQPFETGFSRADFVAIARGMGGSGVRVEAEADVDQAIAEALAAEGPFVIDVVIDETEIAPAIGRNQSLVRQGVNTQPTRAEES
jgi:acetolactate synthase-1/2/3 large subunit